MVEEVQAIEGQIMRRIAYGNTLPVDRLVKELVSDKQSFMPKSCL